LRVNKQSSTAAVWAVLRERSSSSRVPPAAKEPSTQPRLPPRAAIVVATDLHDSADVPPGVTYRKLDVSQPEQWRELGSWIETEHGRLDGLVNNAGTQFRARLDEVEVADWERVLSVNLTGTLLGIQTAISLMHDGGSIVNVSSIAGMTGHFPVAYTVSKWGVRGLSRVASMELGSRGIRVNSIYPGYIETPMAASAGPAVRTANIVATLPRLMILWYPQAYRSHTPESFMASHLQLVEYIEQRDVAACVKAIDEHILRNFSIDIRLLPLPTVTVGATLNGPLSALALPEP
jgi:NAD(P)-dependent dehydrogenase (short-subunit alcohol dehydrogenase family)